jgi:molybdopterin biosynthesis enzyme
MISSPMTSSQRLPALLTPLDAALAALLRDLAAVPPVELPLAQAMGLIAAEMPALPAVPSRNIAAVDGWALHARDLIGASSYTPLPLAKPPVWVEAGDVIPSDCDCVIDSEAVDLLGPVAQVLAETIPGQGVRRSGGDIAQDSFVATGQPVRALDLLVARAAGLQSAQLRRPRLRIVNIPSTSGQTTTAELIAESARAAGAGIIRAQSGGRDAASISEALVTDDSDLLVAIGGSGVGRGDAGVAALARCGEIIAHGLALQPGRTAAVGRIGKIPVIVLPGATDQALAAWWTLALPALDRLSGRRPRVPLKLPLARKVASRVGIAEIVLLERRDAGWMPLSVGEMSLTAIARADGRLVVPDGSEGHAAGTPVDAYMLRDSHGFGDG